jgi:hypothetical protein
VCGAAKTYLLVSFTFLKPLVQKRPKEHFVTKVNILRLFPAHLIHLIGGSQASFGSMIHTPGGVTVGE